MFGENVKLGVNSGDIASGGVEKCCGIFDAFLTNCTVGDNCRIAKIGVHIANYNIGDDVCIENVGRMETKPGSTFGNGVEIEPINEGGGRELTLFNRLDSQFAHLLCLHKYRPQLNTALAKIAEQEVKKARADRGTVGNGARIANVKNIEDVCIGESAVIESSASLVNGTVLSSQNAATTVGADVQAEDFIIGEGSTVDSGAIVCKSFVGQGCQVGKQFSSEGSAFFANCEAFHGEACSVFAGPYTVTHHKSTLLIAGVFSFYNAGSGTNQSNHLYKLGPLHEGKLERGCKTGSFSYMMWPCRVGPFSVVLGKHTRTFDTADFPFSYIEATAEGRCQMTPGFNFTTVGTVRDGAKWPARDRRKGDVKRDRISFDVLSPLTVGRMLRGSARMKELQDTTDRKISSVTLNGAEVKRVLLRTGQKNYRTAIHMYLLEKVVSHVEAALVADATSIADAVKVSSDAILSEDWVDIGGQLMPQQRLCDLAAAAANGDVKDLDSLNAPLDAATDAYETDEWAWVCWAYQKAFGSSLADATADDLAKIADDLAAVRGKFLNLVLADARKEFDEVVQTGFGQDGTEADVAADFTAVRGEYETNKFVQQINNDIAALNDRVEKFKAQVSAL